MSSTSSRPMTTVNSPSCVTSRPSRSSVRRHDQRAMSLDEGGAHDGTRIALSPGEFIRCRGQFCRRHIDPVIGFPIAAVVGADFADEKQIVVHRRRRRIRVAGPVVSVVVGVPQPTVADVTRSIGPEVVIVAVTTCRGKTSPGVTVTSTPV